MSHSRSSSPTEQIDMIQKARSVIETIEWRMKSKWNEGNGQFAIRNHLIMCR